MKCTSPRPCGTHLLVLIAPIVTLLATPLLAKESSGGGYLGIGFSVDQGTGVLTVRQILPDSPAAVAEVRVADELVQVEKEDVRFPSHRAALEFLSEKARVGVSLALTVIREGSRLESTWFPSRHHHSSRPKTKALSDALTVRADERMCGPACLIPCRRETEDRGLDLAGNSLAPCGSLLLLERLRLRAGLRRGSGGPVALAVLD